MEVLFFFCSWWFGVQCFFGAAGCDSTVGMRGTIFISMYVSAYAGSANLLRHSEGATWLAIVVVRRNDIRLRVVPLSFSPSSETQNKPARKKWPREILGREARQKDSSTKGPWSERENGFTSSSRVSWKV